MQSWLRSGEFRFLPKMWDGNEDKIVMMPFVMIFSKSSISFHISLFLPV